MAMYVTENQIFIFVADSDAIDENRIKNSTNSSSQTSNYCPPESHEQNEKFYQIIGSKENLPNKPVYFNVSKVKEYKKNMLSRIKNKYSNIYKGNMSDFESNCDELIALGKDTIISSSIVLTGERPYLNFSDCDNWKLFKSILFGESSIIVIESKDDRFVIYPMFRPLFSKPEDAQWDEKSSKIKFLTNECNLTEEELGNELKGMYDNGEKVLNIHLFGIKYGKYIREKNYNIKKIISFAGIEPSYFAELNKGIKLSSFVGIKNDDCETNNEVDNYSKFKSLLKWFVNQLNVNNDIVEGISHSGQGYNGDAIRNYYNEWRDYGDFTLDCNIQSGYKSAISNANYINVTRTGFNIRPEFDENTKKVINLGIDLYNFSDDIKLKYKDLLDVKYSISELSLFDDQEPNDKLKELFDNYYSIIKDLYLNKFEKAKEGRNVYFYGAPGCGKSYHVQKILKENKIPEENIFRVTFHPEYSNVDFVGQILPTIEKKEDGTEIVKYKFNEGPFTKALKRCYETNEMVYLIIEELNRGNAPAIFGDLFQLLDREDDFSKENYNESEYPITNINIYNHLKDELGSKFNRDDGNIVIPSNLTIYATLNTSDQSVFTLDTAFKRRWEEESISNEFAPNDEHPYKNFYIPGANITWQKFVEKVNAKIVEPQITNSSTEDKRLGKFFVKKNCLTSEFKPIDECKKEATNFAHKVLEYIWNDVCRYNKSDWFDLGKYKTLEDLINGYMKEQCSIFNIKFDE